MHTYPALPALVFALVALLLKATLLSGTQVIARSRARTFLIPEDARIFRVTVSAHEAPFVARCGQVWRNDMENIPLFFVVAFAFTVCGGDLKVATWMFGAYVGLRYLHTMFFLRGLQPWRAAAFLASLGIMWTVAVRTVGLVVGWG